MRSTSHKRVRASERIVVIGGRSFVGRALVDSLRGAGQEVLSLSSSDIDLGASGAEHALASSLRTGDRVVLLAGIAPKKPARSDLLVENARLARAVAAALVRVPAAQVVYLSSDAVYPDGARSICEATCADPSSLYGMSHRVRESILSAACADRLAIVRSAMVYGAGDPHDAYGPNRMARSALSQRRIELFGEGEDVRDYVALQDLVALLVLILGHTAIGVWNAASGEAVSARVLAERIRDAAGADVRIESRPRSQSASERSFDVRGLRAAFPEWRCLPLTAGIARLVSDLEREPSAGGIRPQRRPSPMLS